MENEENLVASNGTILTDGEFNAPFDPTSWLRQLEEYFNENDNPRAAESIGWAKHYHIFNDKM